MKTKIEILSKVEILFKTDNINYTPITEFLIECDIIDKEDITLIETGIKMSDKVKDYLKSHEGKELLKRHKLTEEGVWNIHGEDPNCDFGGYHSNPFLGAVEGRLDKVLEHAVNKSSFYTWGSGGIIKREYRNVIKL